MPRNAKGFRDCGTVGSRSTTLMGTGLRAATARAGMRDGSCQSVLPLVWIEGASVSGSWFAGNCRRVAV
jgi:hypothetical protein